MKKIILVICFIQYFFIGISQTPIVEWVYKLSESNQFSEGKLIKSDFEQNTYVIGEFYNSIDCDPSIDSLILDEHNFNGDCYIQKIDKNGNLIWAKNIGPSVHPTDIFIDTFNNVILTGNYFFTVDFDPNDGVFSKTSLGYQDVFLLKLDQNGDFIWMNSYGSSGSEQQSHLVNIDNSNFYFTYGLCTNSSTQSYANYKNDIQLIKLNTDGNELWIKNFPSIGSGGINSIKTDRNNEIYMVGSFNRKLDLDPTIDSVIISSNNISDYEYDIFVLKLDSSGNYLWGHRLGSEKDDFGIDLDLDSIGNLYITGGYSGTVDFNPSINVNNLTTGIIYDIFILKLSNNGLFTWVYGMEQNSNAIGRKIIYDKSGFLYNMGRFDSNSNLNPTNNPPFNTDITGEGYQTFVRKLDLDANLIWGLYTQGTRFSFPYDMTVDNENKLYLTGWFNGEFDCDISTTNNNLFYADASNSFVFKINQDSFLSIQKLNTKSDYYQISPNPIQNDLFIRSSKGCYFDQIIVKNVLGQMVSSFRDQFSNEVKLEFTEPQGVYFIEIYDKSEIKHIEKIIKY